MSPSPAFPRLLLLFYWSAVGCLFLPLVLIALASVNDATVVSFPIEAMSLRWYRSVLADREIVRAFLYSSSAAGASAALAVAMGSWIAFAARSLTSPRLRGALLAGACLPIVTPGIVAAIAMRLFIHRLGLDPGFAAIVLGHAAHASPYAVIIVGTRLGAMPRELNDAARTLGANALATFLRVTLPWLRPALGAATALALLESFDDFLRSYFLGGYQPTLPVLIYGRLFSGLSPEIGAATTLVLALSISLGLAGEPFYRRARE